MLTWRCKWKCRSNSAKNGSFYTLVFKFSFFVLQCISFLPRKNCRWNSILAVKLCSVASLFSLSSVSHRNISSSSRCVGIHNTWSSHLDEYLKFLPNLCIPSMMLPAHTGASAKILRFLNPVNCRISTSRGSQDSRPYYKTERVTLW